MASALHEKIESLSARLKAENEEKKKSHVRFQDEEELNRGPFKLDLNFGASAREGRSGRPGNLQLCNSPGNECSISPSPRQGRPKLDLPFKRCLQREKSNDIDEKLKKITEKASALVIDEKKYPLTINDLVWIEEIGSGTCGVVNKMLHRETETVMAVKKMGRSPIFEEEKRILMDLDVIMKCNDCQYIVKSYGAFISQADVYICMELMGTCLEKLLKKTKTPIPEPILGKITVSVVHALQYLKEKHGVMHRDVKPSNILLNESGSVKLCDFGISGRLVDSKAKTRSAGCAAYMAPERIDPPDPSNPDYDVRADVWSLGISLVELATGQFPYKDCVNEFDVLSRIMNEEPPILSDSSGFSGDFKSFISYCFENLVHQDKNPIL